MRTTNTGGSMSEVRVRPGASVTSVTFEEGVELCRKLKLVEFMRHDNNDYTRFTQRGIDVMATLTEILQQQAKAKEYILKGS